jgi:hypothetical protein
MITVVLLNWGRPANTLLNIRRYASYGLVSRILCFNNGPSLGRAKALPKKCVLIEASSDLGLYSRFAAGSLARTDAIFHADDDLGIPEETLNALYVYWSRAQHCCHGLYGRNVKPVYQTRNVIGPVEVVLTRALICSRRINNAALSAAPLFEDLGSVPHGNGEDIILSFTAMASSRSLNCTYALAAENYADHAEIAIHRRWRGHYEHRQRVVSRCRHVFSL